MNDREREITRIETTGKHTIVVKLMYDTGGANYFSGTIDPRGYYIIVTPVIIENGTRTFRMFAGTKKLIKQARRFSSKTFDKIDVDSNTVTTLVRHVCRKNSLVIAESNQDYCRGMTD